MRALRIVIIGFALGGPFGTIPSVGAETKLPKAYVQIESLGDIGSSWTRVFQKGSLWVCQTDAFPYAESVENPLEGLDLSRFEKTSKTAHCRQPVEITDFRGPKLRKAHACEDSPKIRAWMDRIDRLCGRRR